MATKAKGKLATAKRDTKTPKPDVTSCRSIARALLHPSIQAAITLKEYTPGDAELIGLVEELASQEKAVNDGNLKRAEGMLMVQAHTLDAIFNNLARRAAMNMGEYLDATDRYMRLALKAQSQCRATLETLAAIKNPAPVAFVRQANIGYHQQVNNPAGPAPRAPHAREIENPQNELLEAQPHEWLDTRTASKTVGADPALATVGEIDRAANR